MPNFTYNFLGGGGGMGGACAAGPGATFVVGGALRIALTWPQLLNAQLRLGVYPGGWALDELTWRTLSFTISCAPLAALGGLPPMAPMGVPPGGALPAAPAIAVANVPPSPVAAGVDATERGQLAYHMGTAIGGSLAEYLHPPGGAGATQWYPFHLTRAMTNGGVFNFANSRRPDVVIYAVNPATLLVWRFVVWENKGHCRPHGGRAAIAPALAQAQSLLNMTTIPGNGALGVFGATPCPPWPPDCHLASKVDVLGGNFRVQVVDPPGPPSQAVRLSRDQADNFLRGYYAPFVEAVQASRSTARTYDGRPFRVIKLPKHVRLGLDEEILKAWLRNNFAHDVSRVLAGGYKTQSPDTVHVHATGISTEVPARWHPWPTWRPSRSRPV